MTQYYQILSILVIFGVGVVLGYYVRKRIARKKVDSIEAELQKKISQAKNEAQKILNEAKKKESETYEKLQKEYDQRKKELLRVQGILLKREQILEKKLSETEQKEQDIKYQKQELKKIRDVLEESKKETEVRLEKISGLSKEQAKQELIKQIEREYQKDVLERIKKLEREGIEKFEEKAKVVLAQAIQKYALSQAQEITTTNISLPTDELKGRIIGKEGRNIRAFEQLTGVELIVDETPETVTISSFNPVRREVAKLALEKLIKDSRIQPARIEDKVKEAESEIAQKIKDAGEKAIFETGIIDLNPKLVELLGRLYFRTSYGQNVLLHSMEVALLSEALASEIGANSRIAKKAGFLHDIGKALDHQIQGSHTEIGVKILEKFGLEEEVIIAMRSHHEEYPNETLEGIIVQTADQISGARPGARRESVENYLQRLKELEEIALSFPGVEKAYAISAGREIRVFVKPEEIDDLTAFNLAKDIARQIEQELVYPGEIRVILIRESRIVEYAK